MFHLHRYSITGKYKNKQDKYLKSTLTEKYSRKILDDLMDLMDRKKIFRDPEINLDSLAKMIAVNRNHLSEVINKYKGKNYFDFINSFRIEEVKKHLNNSGDKSILAIAFEAGFNSKTAFNNSFRKYTGMTPSEYKKKNCCQNVNDDLLGTNNHENQSLPKKGLFSFR